MLAVEARERERVPYLCNIEIRGFILNCTIEKNPGSRMNYYYFFWCPLSRHGRPTNVTITGSAFSAPGRVFLGHPCAQDFTRPRPTGHVRVQSDRYSVLAESDEY